MDLGSQVETIVHHLLIGGMTCLGHRDGFPMVSALVYTSWETHPNGQDKSSLQLRGCALQYLLDWSYIPMNWVTINGGWW